MGQRRHQLWQLTFLKWTNLISIFKHLEQFYLLISSNDISLYHPTTLVFLSCLTCISNNLFIFVIVPASDYLPWVVFIYAFDPLFCLSSICTYIHMRFAFFTIFFQTFPTKRDVEHPCDFCFAFWFCRSTFLFNWWFQSTGWLISNLEDNRGSLTKHEYHPVAARNSWIGRDPYS